MDTFQFSNLLFSLKELSDHQLRSLSLQIQKQLETNELNKALEARAQHLDHCIFCGCNWIIRWGTDNGLQRYRCHQCGKTFNELSGTPFTRLRARETLVKYANCMANGDTLRVAAATCNIALSTSFRWRHRFLRAPEEHKATRLGGIVEADETFFRESFKGKRTIEHRQPRHHGRLRKGESALKVPVLVMLDRNGQEADFVLDNNTIEEMYPCMKERINHGSVLCTDGSQVYPFVAEKESLLHKRILNNIPERSIESGTFHI